MGNYNRDNNSRNRYRGNFGRNSNYNRNQGSRREDRQMTWAVCSNCGKDCEVPFKPSGDKPVYCSDCFERMGNNNERRFFDRPRRSDRTPKTNQSNYQLDNISAKLDKIINLLEPKKNVENTNPEKLSPKANISSLKEKPKKINTKAKKK